MTKKINAQEKTIKAEPENVVSVGKTSITIDGQEIVFQKGQTELPGMPDVSRLHKLASSFVTQWEAVEEERETLRSIQNALMIELKSEGRSAFAYNTGLEVIVFEITPSEEKIKVRRQK